jgi:peptide/nickel transport system substrate-binding protein
MPAMRRALLVVCLLAGCRRAEEPRAKAAAGPTVIVCPESGCPLDTGAAHDGGELRVHVEAEPAILCDLVEHDVWSRWIVENQVSETLFYQDPFSGAVAPRLAERFELDGKSLTLHLRGNVKWHDGQPFGAADVVFTLERARDPKVGADQAADLAPVAEIRAPDEKTVVLALARPAPFLKQALAHISILPEHAYRGLDLRKAPASRAPIGTGPFRFKEWRAGEELVIERNPDYWGPRAHVDRIRFRVVRDRNVAYELYKRGELDVMFRLPAGRLDEARADARLTGHRLLAWTMRTYFFVVWNTRRGPLADARVRRALTMLVDRARFIQVAFAGHARAVTGPYPPNTPSYDAALAPWRYDPDGARALLAEAGVKSLKLTFLTTAGSRTVEQLATLMKEDLARAGVELDVAQVDFAVQLERLRRHAFDASALQWTMSLEQDNFTMFHSTQADGGQNYGAWKNADADALLDEIRATPDDGARHALDRRLHALVHREQPYTFLAAPEVQTLEAPRVHSLRPSTDGFNFAEAWVAP